MSGWSRNPLEYNRIHEDNSEEASTFNQSLYGFQYQDIAHPSTEYTENPERGTNPRDIFSRVPSPDGSWSRSITPDSVSRARLERRADVREISKSLVTLEFDLRRPNQREVFYKATSMGSLHGETGIFATGLDSSFGGRGGGSGSWEGRDAPDRRSNMGWTTLATRYESTRPYAEGFSVGRQLDDTESYMLQNTGKLDAKWIGVTLRVTPDVTSRGYIMRNDPGSAANERIIQTREIIPPDRIEIQSITMMLSRDSRRALERHLRDNNNHVDEAFLNQILDQNYYQPEDWDTRPSWGR